MAQIESKAYFRFAALFFMCFICFGSYFCYDLPGSLQDNLERDLHLNITEILLFYSIYSWPNTVFCFLGGYLLDRFFGIRLGTNIYLLLSFIGQIMFATGGYLNMYSLMIIGRFIFGIGSESAAIAQNGYTVRWFKGKELNMVFGLQLSFARIGSTINFLVMEPLYKWVNQYYKGQQCIGIVLFLASLTCLVSLVFSLILGCMDKYRERAQLMNEDEDKVENEKIKLCDIKQFPTLYWLIAVICVAYYISIFPFISISKSFFMKLFHLTAVDANHLSSALYFISTLASPVFGILVDKCGLNLLWMLIAIIYTITAHSIFTFTSLAPIYGIVILGLSYALLASSLWPLVSLIIPEHQLGTAYGICQAIQNLGLATFSIIVGKVIEKKGYIYTEAVFQSCLYLTLVVCIVLWILNSMDSGILNFTKSERLAYEEYRTQTAGVNNVVANSNLYDVDSIDSTTMTAEQQS